LLQAGSTVEAHDKIYIIGIGDDGLDGLTQAARVRIEQADLLIGSPHTLTLVPPLSGKRLEVGADLDRVVQRLQQPMEQRVVILMMGDPLFYGTARFLCESLGKDRFEVIPHVSSMQLAFARVKESWDEAYFADLSKIDLDRAVEQIRTVEKAGLFPSEHATPGRLATTLLERRIDYFTAYICENLGSPDERVTSAELAEIAKQDFSPLSVMILVRKPDRPDQPDERAGRRLFGNPDEVFLQSRPKRGLLTPAEVRCVALSEMNLAADSVVWDVGAGSGAVAVEAAQIAARGTVYAVEMDIEDCELISANAKRFGVQNLVPVLGKAPEAWADLPDPDAIFVGGTGRQVGQIVAQAFERLRSGGSLVANVRSIENVATVRRVFLDAGVDDRVWMVNLARGVFQFEQVRFESLNPTFLIGAVKK
jgi:precorrin-6Y C5,15-methyltransferase (decarboxylating)